MKRTFLWLVLCGGCLFGKEPVVLDAPESACWDPKSQTWFVSNLGGGIALIKDGNGWIARFDRTGSVISPRWVQGLDSPTGIAVRGDSLFVVDRGCVVEISIAQSAILRKMDLPGSKIPNDIAIAPGGDLFISDIEANRIYRIDSKNKVEVWLESDELMNPNGLCVDGQSLIVAAWGPIRDIKTFGTRHPGMLLRVGLKDRRIQKIGDGTPIGHLDGLVRIRDGYIVSDWLAGKILKVSTKGEVRLILSGLEKLADIGLDGEGKVLAVPMMGDNRLFLLNLE